MIVGRTLGWFLVILAIVMASGEAVMALGRGAYNGLVTEDVWVLLVGQSPQFVNLSDSNRLLTAAGVGIMQMPAWVVIGVLGFIFAHLCRKRRDRRRIFYRAV